MNTRKIEFTNDVVSIVCNICTTLFNVTSDDQLCNVFGLTRTQMEEVLNRLVDTLPDGIFNHTALTEEIKNILAREFIFFQVQERWNDAHYQDDLTNFISIFSRDIKQRIETYKTQQLREVR